MALTLGADSYVTLTDANTYWSDRNNSTWSAASDANKEKALREATQYLDGAYEFLGNITSVSQTLAWPRSGVVISEGNFDGVFYQDTDYPKFLTQACNELALDALGARLRPSQERGGKVVKEKVDVIEVEYSEFAPSQRTFDFVTLLLKPIVKGVSGQLKLVRV